ncbi:collagen alpha-2(I) chain-like [Ammospiza caudacuta]|uniref:collagen alpha-2(I) chain-like n=1 Tax=Ammospiza caudacuta TaxID=2857398 RepID=UPI002738C099|nr:collagen alpha-2(I) chain-like [Ammospiza caudacuta]
MAAPRGGGGGRGQLPPCPGSATLGPALAASGAPPARGAGAPGEPGVPVCDGLGGLGGVQGGLRGSPSVRGGRVGAGVCKGGTAGVQGRSCARVRHQAATARRAGGVRGGPGGSVSAPFRLRFTAAALPAPRPLLYEAIFFSRSRIPGAQRGSLGSAGGLQPLSGRLSVTGARGAPGWRPRPFLFVSGRRGPGSDVRCPGGGTAARHGLQLLTTRGARGRSAPPPPCPEPPRPAVRSRGMGDPGDAGTWGAGPLWDGGEEGPARGRGGDVDPAPQGTVPPVSDHPHRVHSCPTAPVRSRAVPAAPVLPRGAARAGGGSWGRHGHPDGAKRQRRRLKIPEGALPTEVEVSAPAARAGGAGLGCPGPRQRPPHPAPGPTEAGGGGSRVPPRVERGRPRVRRHRESPDGGGGTERSGGDGGRPGTGLAPRWPRPRSRRVTGSSGGCRTRGQPPVVSPTAPRVPVAAVTRSERRGAAPGDTAVPGHHHCWRGLSPSPAQMACDSAESPPAGAAAALAAAGGPATRRRLRGGPRLPRARWRLSRRGSRGGAGHMAAAAAFVFALFAPGSAPPRRQLRPRPRHGSAEPIVSPGPGTPRCLGREGTRRGLPLGVEGRRSPGTAGATTAVPRCGNLRETSVRGQELLARVRDRASGQRGQQGSDRRGSRTRGTQGAALLGVWAAGDKARPLSPQEAPTVPPVTVRRAWPVPCHRSWHGQAARGTRCLQPDSGRHREPPNAAVSPVPHRGDSAAEGAQGGPGDAAGVARPGHPVGQRCQHRHSPALRLAPRGVTGNGATNAPPGHPHFPPQWAAEPAGGKGKLRHGGGRGSRCLPLTLGGLRASPRGSEGALRPHPDGGR